ncbi:hypothetical protein VCHA53O466_140049 [Vibrio chagasii]|nr:hypothetical protein VCHA53O466_140049 [Vibrio chagasii]
MNAQNKSLTNVANLLPVFAVSIRCLDSEFAKTNGIDKAAISSELNEAKEQILHFCSNQQDPNWIFDAGTLVSKSIQSVKAVLDKIEVTGDSSPQAMGQYVVMQELLSAIGKM